MKLGQLQFKLTLFMLCFSCLAGNCQRLRLSRPNGDYKHLAFEKNVGDSIIKFQGYAVLFSFKQNLPLYTFHRLTKDQITIENNRTVARRSSSFRPWLLTSGKFSATNIDFKSSGYDRGHMVPAGDFAWNKPLKDETFWYVNINPQSPNLNRGMWAYLENEIRQLVLTTGADVFVVTGVVFSELSLHEIGPNCLRVPSSFFKIVYSPEKSKMFAFLFDNTIESYEGEIQDFQVSVDFIEAITLEDFFDSMDDELELQLESVVFPFSSH